MPVKYDAVKFLTDLFLDPGTDPDTDPDPAAGPTLTDPGRVEGPIPTDSDLPRPGPAADLDPRDLDPDRYELWVERAGVMQFDGGLAREHAEALALREVIQSPTPDPTDGPRQQDVDVPNLPPTPDPTDGSDGAGRVAALTDADFGPIRPPLGDDPAVDPAAPLHWVCSRDPDTGLPSTGVEPPGRPVPDRADYWTQEGVGRWVRVPRPGRRRLYE